MLFSCVPVVFALYLIQNVHCFNFPWEGIQLSDADARNSSAIAFGVHNSSSTNATARCKAFPGDANWPSITEWISLNASLEGALIKGAPPAAVCYQGQSYDAAQCAIAKVDWYNSTFFTANPTSQMEQWQTGNNCPLPFVSPFSNVTANYTCDASAMPAYVVKATTVKHIQVAVNFARNKNLRVVIKNTGHDFLGRSAGGGALGIWVHSLKDSEYLPSAQIGSYRGMAMRMGAAMESWELHNIMNKYNITLVTPISTTVGAYGGFMQGGGHSILTSYYGLMSDQVLSMEVVTADGRFVHADPDENDDLFFAIRGGGGGTFGVVTSVVVKAYPSMQLSTSSIDFTTGPAFTGPVVPASPGISNETFWAGVRTYFSHVTRIVDAKGVGTNYLSVFNIPSFRPMPPNFTLPNITLPSGPVLSFTATVILPGKSPNEARNFMAPLITDLNKAGINITNRKPMYYPTTSGYGGPRPGFGPGEGVGNMRFASRLLPRANFEDPSSDSFNNLITAIKSFLVDGGYSFHSLNHGPTLELAGTPGSSSAVNPAWRTAVAHASGFDNGLYGPGAPAAEQIASHTRLNQYMNKWRAATPGSGAYMNEADTEEPNWQQSFYGNHYDRLVQIKKNRDPWGLFYTITGVNSEGWAVEGTGGLPIQSGRLCKTGSVTGIRRH